MLGIKVAGAIRRGPFRPRMIEHSLSVPECERHCNECGCAPPTRWWCSIHLITLLLRTAEAKAFLDKHAPDSPVYLCDRCTQPVRRESPEGVPWDELPESDEYHY